MGALIDLSDKEVRNALLSEVKKGCGINGCIKVENNEEIYLNMDKNEYNEFLEKVGGCMYYTRQNKLNKLN
jgi:hypothetical protein